MLGRYDQTCCEEHCCGTHKICHAAAHLNCKGQHIFFAESDAGLAKIYDILAFLFHCPIGVADFHALEYLEGTTSISVWLGMIYDMYFGLDIRAFLSQHFPNLFHHSSPSGIIIVLNAIGESPAFLLDSSLLCIIVRHEAVSDPIILPIRCL